MPEASPRKVVAAGAGVAALELALALRDVAGERVDLTLVAPTTEFVEWPDAVLEPFVAGGARHYDLRPIADAAGFALVTDRVVGVASHAGRVALESGATLDFDELVVATGGARTSALAHATTVHAAEAETLGWVVDELERGFVEHVAFVIAPGSGWPLPVYELGLMLASRVPRGASSTPAISLVTCEARALEAFGGEASDAVERLLREAGVTLRPGVQRVTRTPSGVRVDASDEELLAGRVLALPRLDGPGVSGIPADGRGFVRVGAGFQVPGHPSVHAIGDASGHPVKQGALAAQQAETVATGIARRAGVKVPEVPYEGLLRATLVTGTRPEDRLYLSGRVWNPAASEVATKAPDWAVRKVAAPRLTAFLSELDNPGAGLRRAERA